MGRIASRAPRERAGTDRLGPNAGMFTVCAKCNLRLTVTASDLRAAQGYVRCGRCHNVFNALAALADDPVRHADALAPRTRRPAQVLTAARPDPQPPVEPPQAQKAEAVQDAKDAKEAKDAQAAYDEPENPAHFASSDADLEFNPARPISMKCSLTDAR